MSHSRWWCCRRDPHTHSWHVCSCSCLCLCESARARAHALKWHQMTTLVRLGESIIIYWLPSTVCSYHFRNCHLMLLSSLLFPHFIFVIWPFRACGLRVMPWIILIYRQLSSCASELRILCILLFWSARQLAWPPTYTELMVFYLLTAHKYQSCSRFALDAW